MGKIEFSEIMARIVLEEEYSEYVVEYKQRFEFLYRIILDSVSENSNNRDMDIISNEIAAFETNWKISILSSLYLFEKFTQESAIKVFSLISFHLAEDKWKGITYPNLVSLLKEIYLSMLDDNIIDKNIQELYKMVISETIVDFEYANGNNNVSFRMKNLID